MQTCLDFILWLHCEQDVPDKNKKISDRTRGMTGVDPSTKYEKPRQDVGVFLLPRVLNQAWMRI
jgi:hypothetical protein